jgi:hypothetical protein
MSTFLVLKFQDFKMLEEELKSERVPVEKLCLVWFWRPACQALGSMPEPLPLATTLPLLTSITICLSGFD